MSLPNFDVLEWAKCNSKGSTWLPRWHCSAASWPNIWVSLDSPVGLSPDIHLVNNSCGREICWVHLFSIGFFNLWCLKIGHLPPTRNYNFANLLYLPDYSSSYFLKPPLWDAADPRFSSPSLPHHRPAFLIIWLTALKPSKLPSIIA